MIVLRKVGVYPAIAVLFLSLGFVSCQQAEKEETATVQPDVPTQELIERMQDLSAEIGRIREKMEENSTDENGEKIMLSVDQMAFMCENMQPMIDNMTKLIQNLDRMASKEEPLTNEAYREYAENMLRSMESCVDHAEALWEGM